MTHLLHRTRLPIPPRDLSSLKAAGAVLCGVLLCVGLQGCASRPSPEPTASNRVSNSSVVPEFHVVQRGDTVSKIAARYGLSYPEIGRINQLDSQYTIYPNQRLRLPRGSTHTATQVAARPANSTAVRTPPPIRSQPLPPAAATTSSVTAIAAPALAQGIAWQWPTRNPILQEFNQAAQIKGIRFDGKLGDPVWAAAAGTVVYANNGLTEYGNLVLLRHPDGYITAYAHNQRLLVQEGQTVDIGQPIAEIGNSGSSRVMLEFQIRKNGKPVDPKQVLPRR